MSGTVVVGCADQTLAYELRALLAEISDLEVVGLAETTTELTELVVAHQPNLLLVHDRLGPLPVHQVVRDLGLRRPGTVSVVVSSDPEPEALAAAMDAGARGVITYPLTFEDVQQRVTNALEWSRHIQGMLTAAEQGDASARGRATVVTVTGSKGGVGTTSVVTNLAWDIRRQLPELSVAVVDADLEKGDVTSYLAASYRTSIADLAKVSEDLSPRTVADAVFEHESGLHMLLPPEDVRDVEWVTPTAIRQILFLLRQQYDLVLVDAGAHVTPVQAAIVEVSDEVVQVVTPDLISLRALRRNLGWWESLGVRKPDAVRVLLNRHTKSDEVQPEAVRQLSPAPVLAATVPHQGRRLEASTNSRSPHLTTDEGWWRALRAVGHELGVARALDSGEPEETDSRSRRGRRSRSAQQQEGERSAGDVAPEAEAPVVTGRRAARAARERGSMSLELLGVVPALALLVAVLCQLALAGVTYVYTGHAATQAARQAAIAEPWESWRVREAAQDAFPQGLRSRLDVGVDYSPSGSVQVDVTAGVPRLMPGVMRSGWDVTVDRQVVREP
ncbi:hypothetical protein DNL40_14690 [Xylanimonas oleitrophica]|uniref:Response regulatory domain-containing protein n=1 Tax=Xylanimonas oleitrophica TaxID=2607479 RepID=A0A2W5WVK7_9MICO|nr:cellulose synthase operon protein YhjQ/BcsQ [Xylanimonas oleitrophica]PZR51855.1 hypothetical protein DNL40_14690 [Xylanimonas oleitrophica]